ncbi:MAG: HU family DNA-binding protein [Paludibacteraceae bacterium]|nr:HU family DNA-binding protein [Paludibacteraceae bacterium]
MTKLNWIELRKAVAAHLGTSERETAAFMNALITQIQLGLKNERQVRITGLGTFRLQEVSPRKSVDVTTGQAIVLPGYNKVVFVPEIGIKELIQTSTPTTNEEEDTPLQRLGKQADEIVAIIQRDINTAVPAEADSQSSTGESSEADSAEPVQAEEKKTEKAYHFVRDLLITISVIIVLLVGCYFGLRTGIRHWIDDKLHQVEQVITPTERQETRNEKQETRTEEQDTIALEVNQVEDILTPRVYTEFIATETVGKGSRLAYLARKYYGQTDLWVFIYEANRDQFPNPNDIKTGDKLRIPKLSTEQQDLSNPANRQLVDQLLEEYTK